MDDREFSYYPGDDGGSEYLFATDLWIEFQKQLSTADTIMRMLSVRYKLKFSSNIKGSWPSRRLCKKEIFKFSEVRILLNSNYLMDGKIFYELNKYVAIDFLGIYKRELEFSRIKRYSLDQVSDKNLILNDLESIIHSL